MSKQFFHFTLGPVQGFVAQARRTRDFWAGSFLLSWLTTHAMKEVIDNGGEISMPAVANDKLLQAVCGEKTEDYPTTGSLPNNFIAKVPENFDGLVATEAVQTAWKSLADAVWTHDELDKAGVSRKLWDDQIETFWEIAWVISDSDDASILAQRKNWRSHMPPEQLGDKCTMMGEWQELSGNLKPTQNTRNAFWNPIIEKHGLDFREGERLCAIAYVKRRFVDAWSSLEGHQNWILPKSIPSTSYMAAVHWLDQVMQTADAAKMKAFHHAAKALDHDYGEWSTNIACIHRHINASERKRFASLDGRLFFESELENTKEYPANTAKDLKKALKALRSCELPSGSKIGAPSPFYAILMMDGDSLGATKRALTEAKQEPTALSEALAAFTDKVKKIVPRNNGFLVYAGGDDVLAILPLEDALPCALDCRIAYQKAFEGKLAKEHAATISAAIEFAHMKMPLTMVLRDAHRLLDDIAKDQTGRDAIACRIWKPGGQQQTWAMPWDEAIETVVKDGVEKEVIKMVGLATKLSENASDDPGYASKLLFHIRETLLMMDGGNTLSAEVIADILVADYISSGLLEKVDDKEAKARALIEPLLNQCRVFINKEATGNYTADGALLLRFLAQKGVE